MTLISDVMHDIKMVHPATYEFLKQYISPKNETSLFKGIPINDESLDHVKVVKGHIPIRVRFRGPRPEVSKLGQRRYSFNRQSYCLKCDAVSMALYDRR